MHTCSGEIWATVVCVHIMVALEVYGNMEH